MRYNHVDRFRSSQVLEDDLIVKEGASLEDRTALLAKDGNTGAFIVFSEPRDALQVGSSGNLLIAVNVPEGSEAKVRLHTTMMLLRIVDISSSSQLESMAS